MRRAIDCSGSVATTSSLSEEQNCLLLRYGHIPIINFGFSRNIRITVGILFFEFLCGFEGCEPKEGSTRFVMLERTGSIHRMTLVWHNGSTGNAFALINHFLGQEEVSFMKGFLLLHNHGAILVLEHNHLRRQAGGWCCCHHRRKSSCTRSGRGDRGSTQEHSRHSGAKHGDWCCWNGIH